MHKYQTHILQYMLNANVWCYVWWYGRIVCNFIRVNIKIFVTHIIKYRTWFHVQCFSQSDPRVLDVNSLRSLKTSLWCTKTLFAAVKKAKKITKEEEKGDSKINEVKPDLWTIDIDTSKLTAGLYLEAKSKQNFKIPAMQ